MTHEDKFGRELKAGDLVELLYGGDQHYARVINRSRALDVDHIELQLVTNVSVPTAAVTKRSDKNGHDVPAPQPPAEPDRPQLEAPPAETRPTVQAGIAAQQQAGRPDEKTPTTPRRSTHRPAPRKR